MGALSLIAGAIRAANDFIRDMILQVSQETVAAITEHADA